MSLQILKTRQVESKVETINRISQQQSLEVVMTFVHGGISTWTYLRNIFPDKAFELQTYPCSDEAIPFEDYVDRKLGNGKKKPPSTSMRVLRRGPSKRVDAFLNMLERAVFPALSDSSLQGLQLAIHPSPKLEDRDKVLETSTFSFEYSEGQLQGLVVEDSAGTTVGVSVRDTNKALQSTLQKIMEVCGKLPDLPEERFIALVLFYVPGREPTDMPRGFTGATSSQLTWADSSDWEKSTTAIDNLGAGFHNATLKVSYMHPTSSALALAQQPEKLPEDLIFTSKVPRTADIDEEEDQEDSGAGVMDRVNGDPVYPGERARTPNSLLTEQSLAEIRREVSRQSGGHEVEDSNTRVMKAGLGAMLGEERFSIGETQTQQPLAPIPPASQLSSMSTAVVPPAKADACNAKAGTAHSKSRTAEDDDETVRCLCAIEEREGAMIECSVCKTLQHLTCLGYVPHDKRVPEKHTCLMCLVGDDEERIQELKDLAWRRRAMIYVGAKRGCEAWRDLSDELGIERAAGKELHLWLKQRRYMYHTQGSHKAGFKATGKPLFQVINKEDDKEQWAEMMAELFDPGAELTKPTASSNSGTPMPLSTQVKNLFHTQDSGLMPPPPATPFTSGGGASRRKSVNSDATTVTPSTRHSKFGTPTSSQRATDRRLGRGGESGVMSAKRKGGKDEDDVDSGDAERNAMTKRYRSVQSVYAIDASGINSSPATINGRQATR